MNKRQKKKAFKKKYGANPPKNISVFKIERAAEYIINIWEQVKKALIKIKEIVLKLWDKIPEEQKMSFRKQADFKKIQHQAEEGERVKNESDIDI